MAETPPITPLSPPTTVTAGNTPAATPAPVPQTPQTVLTAVVVQQAPPDMLSPVPGMVIASNPQTQEVRIQTAQSEVAVKSAVPLPPGTEVSLELYTDQTQTRANIIVLRQAIALSQELEKIITSPAHPSSLPPLQEGKTVTALRLPEQPPAKIDAAAPEPPPQPIIKEAPIRQAPAALTLPPRPLPVTGTVIASDPQKQEIRIQTTAGEVNVRSSAELQPGIEVSLEIYSDRNQTRANIAILRQTPDLPKELKKIIPPRVKEKEPARTQQQPERPSVKNTAAPAPPAIKEAPVKQAPSVLTLPARPVPVTGTVIASSPQTQEVHIPTTQGEVNIQSAVTLPPGTKVSLDIYTDQTQTRANIAVLQQTVNLSQDVEKIIPKPALLEQPVIKTDASKSSLTPAMPNVIDQLMKEGISPSPSLTTQEIIGGNKPLNTPPKPDIIRQLLSAYLPQVFGGKADIPTTPESTVPDILDNNLLQIMRAQMQAKATQQAIQSPPPLPTAPSDIKTAASPLPFPVPETLNALFSSMENMPAQKASVFTALFQQLIPQAFEATVPVPQNIYQLHILKILPPETPPQQVKIILQKITDTPQPPQQAEVEMTTSSGLPILKTPDNSRFVVRTPVSTPIGSVVIFEAKPMTPEQVMESILSAKTPVIADFDPQSSEPWSALQEALQTVPPTAQAFRNTIPTPTPHLVPTALFFLAALRLGTVDSWLGSNTLQALRQTGKKELAERLGTDFSRISNHSKEVLADDWRSISMPLLHDEQISQMQFYVRQQHGQNQREKGEKPATRFILNLSLSRMGEMQLDGYVQKKNFDIIVRTGERLPLTMRQEIMKRFAQGLDQVQMQGGISFQTKQQSWVIPETGTLKKEI
jgi:hypothetical protein